MGANGMSRIEREKLLNVAKKEDVFHQTILTRLYEKGIN